MYSYVAMHNFYSVSQSYHNKVTSAVACAALLLVAPLAGADSIEALGSSILDAPLQQK